MVPIGWGAVFLGLLSLVLELAAASEGLTIGRTGGTVLASRIDSRRSLHEENVTCPLDFSFLKKFPWIRDVCNEGAKTPGCCTAALAGMGLGMAKYLKETELFHLHDLPTSNACLSSFRINLRRIGLQRDIVQDCFEQQRTLDNYSAYSFLYNPHECQGIYTVKEFRSVQAAAGSMSMDTSCQGTLSVGHCGPCVEDMMIAVDKMGTLNSSTGTNCFDYVIVYVAGIVNSDGPWGVQTARCLFGAVVESSSQKGRHMGVYIGFGVGIAVFILIILCGLIFFARQHRKETAINREFVTRNNCMLQSNGITPVWFEWSNIRSATRNFSRDRLLGGGSYGSVYKATFKDGRTVAVKQFRNCTPDGDPGFLNEVEALIKLKHRNLVNLQGCCIASSRRFGHQRLLVYNYMSNRSLADYLFNPFNPVLSWEQRQNIAIGVAQGLAYLHTDTEPQIIHRDIKSSNILLDENLDAHVADFGLAKLASEENSLQTSHLKGTLGYVAPEYGLYGQLTEKSDVYSFGVCLLELLSGRPALLIDPKKTEQNVETPDPNYFITEWAWSLIERDCAIDVIDSRIRVTRNHHSSMMMKRYLMVAMLCAHVMVSMRPTMREVLRMLEGHSEVPFASVLERPLLPLSCKASDLAKLGHYEALEWPASHKNAPS